MAKKLKLKSALEIVRENDKLSKKAPSPEPDLSDFHADNGYWICEGDNLTHLEDLVNEQIAEGYPPLGGVCVVSTDKGLKFYQAVFDPSTYEDKFRGNV